MSAGPLRVRYLEFEAMADIMARFPAGSQQPEVAYSIGKRFGNAVERNRARRRIEAAFRHVWGRSQYRPGLFLVGARRNVLTAPYQDLVCWIEKCADGLAGQTTQQGCDP